MTDAGTVKLGAVVHLWGAPHQDRLLLECLAPAVAELRGLDLASGFWFDRLDARGPHLFAVLTVRREAAPEIAGRLGEKLAGHLAAHPSTKVHTLEQLARRHEATRQRQHCEPDKRPGFGANNTFEVFEHPARGYPFWLSAGLRGEDELWERVTGLTLWTISQLAARPGSPATTAAQRYVASVTTELRRAGARPADYWLHHAPTLIPDLFTGMSPEQQAATLTELAADVGAASPGLAAAWLEAEAAPAWPGLPAMIRLILEGSGGDPAIPSPWPLLREIDHTVLKQLGVPAVLQIPPVLYAWRRSAFDP